MDADRSPERVVGERLREREETVALAESVTGGLVGSLLTDVPGSSEYFDRGTVAYSNDAKLHELGVTREALDASGAVSEPVAAEMARRARDRAGTEWGVSTTGIAGPSGGTATKPVGLLYVGVAGAAEWGTGSSFVRTHRHELDGDRAAVKREGARLALRHLDAAIVER